MTTLSIDQIKPFFGKGKGHDDFRRIGHGRGIAGVATPILSDRGSLLSAIIIVTVGITLMILANRQETSPWNPRF